MYREGKKYIAPCPRCPGVTVFNSLDEIPKDFWYYSNDPLDTRALCAKCRTWPKRIIWGPKYITKKAWYKLRYAPFKSLAILFTALAKTPEERWPDQYAKAFEEYDSQVAEPEFDPDFIPGSKSNPLQK